MAAISTTSVRPATSTAASDYLRAFSDSTAQPVPSFDSVSAESIAPMPSSAQCPTTTVQSAVCAAIDWVCLMSAQLFAFASGQAPSSLFCSYLPSTTYLCLWAVSDWIGTSLALFFGYCLAPSLRRYVLLISLMLLSIWHTLLCLDPSRQPGPNLLAQEAAVLTGVLGIVLNSLFACLLIRKSERTNGISWTTEQEENDVVKIQETNGHPAYSGANTDPSRANADPSIKEKHLNAEPLAQADILCFDPLVAPASQSDADSVARSVVQTVPKTVRQANEEGVRSRLLAPDTVHYGRTMMATQFSVAPDMVLTTELLCLDL